PDYYAILGVSPDATPAQLKEAWRKRLKENHPDLLNGLRERYKGQDDAVLQDVLARAEKEAGERTKQINQAYEVLSDPDRRARYDAQRKGQQVPDESSPMSRAYAASRPASAQRPSKPPQPSPTDLQLVARIKVLLATENYKDAYLCAEQIAFK